ncbi:MAG: apolipoprotein A1/A4/E family protein [Saprospiraceae bacterium]|nr:apolipoprotein A1/A4/E family protein [Saprospiraceae bacterium]
MGIFNDFKKLLFGVKSVSKSAADKTIEKGKTAGSKLVNESEELWDKTKDVAEDLGEKIADKTEDLWDKTKGTAEELSDKIADKTEDIWDKTKDTAGEVGEKLVDKTSEVWDKALDSTEGIRGKIKEETSEFIEDAKDVAEDVGSKILKGAGALYEKAKDVGEKIHEKGEALFDDDLGQKDAHADSENKDSMDALFDGDDTDQVELGQDDAPMEDTHGDIADKAQDVVDKMSEKLDETIEKAQSMSDEAAESNTSKTTPAEALKKDPLAGDDFFAKAAAFADGDYDKVRDPFAPDKPKIVGKTEPDKAADEGTVPGFDDLDGDGNEIIDDAQIVSEEE